MKKVCFVLILSMAIMCMYSVMAIAQTDGYAAGVSSYTNSMSDGARTVLIFKGEQNENINGDDIYYIDQDDSGYGFSNLEMMMKRNAPAGVYTVVTDKDGKIATFEISKAQTMVEGNEEMKCLGVSQNQKDLTYSAAYVISTNSLLTENSKISMILGENLYTIDLLGQKSIVKWMFGPVTTTNAQGEKQTTFAIQINGISEDAIKDENGNVTPFKLYFEN